MISPCQFCNLANQIEFANIVYQTELLSCFLDIDPISEGHVLIVPKKHIVELEECNQSTRLDIMNTAALLSTAINALYRPDGVSIMQNGGYFNEVNHYHMHVFARYKNDGFTWIFPDSENKNIEQTATDLRNIIKSVKFKRQQS